MFPKKNVGTLTKKYFYSSNGFLDKKSEENFSYKFEGNKKRQFKGRNDFIGGKQISKNRRDRDPIVSGMGFERFDSFLLLSGMVYLV